MLVTQLHCVLKWRPILLGLIKKKKSSQEVSNSLAGLTSNIYIISHHLGTREHSLVTKWLSPQSQYVGKMKFRKKVDCDRPKPEPSIYYIHRPVLCLKNSLKTVCSRQHTLLAIYWNPFHSTSWYTLYKLKGKMGR